MRLSLRFVLPLALTLALLAYLAMPLADRLTLRWFSRDLELRATLITNAVDEPVESLIAIGDSARIKQFFTRITQDERLYAMALCSSPDATPIATEALPREVNCASRSRYTPSKTITSDPYGPLLVSARPLTSEFAAGAHLILVQDLSFVARRSDETKRYLFYFFIGLAAIVSLVTVVIAQLSWRGWVHGLRSLVRGEGLLRPGLPDSPELRPIADDLRALIRDLEAEHRQRDEEQLTWTPDTLRGILRRELRGHEVIVVSNREPYMHVRENGGIAVQRPASGLVTAVEPVMRACSGTWVAHGSANADRETVDRHDRVAVPPENPAYALRRVWLTPQQETGYYYGFSNEGLWPLCHISHVRPTFRPSDWEQYKKVNRLFAKTVIAESKSAEPIVLVQDYHFALVPRMIREALPQATIISFWHIPWPNPEAFGICPWREELLEGLLGSSILGFHTQFHCNNFVDTVDRLLEARVDRETFTVSYSGGVTAVKRYPISIDWPPRPELLATPVDECRDRIRRRHNLPLDHKVGVGVDRLDYTKGVEERLLAVARLFELHPQWVGQFTFVQIAAPTRSSIDAYRDYERRVRDVADKINRAIGGPVPAIVLVIEHHEPEEIYQYYRGADLCFISSLHDGMNLVAKEFVAARDDGDGVLVLSQFTGAARELPEALIVNPYDVDECASALYVGLTMPARERRARMGLMRGLVQELNVYRWAGRMLMDAAVLRRRGRILRRAEDRPAVARPRGTEAAAS